MGKSSQVQSPDPYATAAAQYQYGTQAANYTKALNVTNEITPYGSTTWTMDPSGIQSTGGTSQPSGSTVPGGAYDGLYNGTYEDGFGDSYPISAPVTNSTGAPQYTETQSLSPIEQQIFNLQTGNQVGQGQAAQGILGQIQSQSGQPIQLQTSVPGGNPESLYNQGFNTALKGNLAAITPQLSQQYDQLDASLRNSGAQPGTPAYDNAMAAFQAQETGTLDQAAGAAENSGLNLEGTLFGQNLQGAEFGNQALIEQQQTPINDYLALTGNGGLSTPSLPSGSSAPSASVSAPDIMSAFNQQFNANVANQNAQTSSANTTEGAIASIIAAALFA